MDEVATLFEAFTTTQHAEGAIVESLRLKDSVSAPTQTCVVRVLDALDLAEVARKDALKAEKMSKVAKNEVIEASSGSCGSEPPSWPLPVQASIRSDALPTFWVVMRQRRGSRRRFAGLTRPALRRC